MNNRILLSLIFCVPMLAREEKCGGCFKQTLCEIKQELREIEHELKTSSTCGNVIPISQATIGINGIEITESGRYCLIEDIVFNGDNATEVGADGPVAIAINANNVDLSLNGHTMTILGAEASGIVPLGTSSNVLIHDGYLTGDGTNYGVNLLTSDVTISNLVCTNFFVGLYVQGYYIEDVLSESIPTFQPLDGCVINNCFFYNNLIGVSLEYINSAQISNCTFDANQFGICAPGRTPFVNNVVIENCSMTNSAIAGIYTTFTQNNWIIRNSQISDSGYDGMIFEGFNNLLVENCNVFNSGANGISAGIRLSNNVEIANCKVVNAGGSALRIGAVENLIVRDSQFTNYVQTTSEVVKIQDVYNGQFSNCYINSMANLADGLFIQNCHGLSVEDCGVNIVCTTTQSTAPVGINLLGRVTGTAVRNCNVSGTPSIGINVGVDPLSLNNQGVIIENCIVQGATEQGIGLLEAVSCAVYDSNVFENSLDGIVTDSCSNCIVRNNTVINNGGTGINNTTGSVASQIYHNVANNNATDYTNVPFVVPFAAAATASWYANIES